MRTITTASGFTFDIDESRMNDMELFDALVAFQSGDSTAMPVVVGKVMGADKKRLYDHLRAENGTVPVDKVAAEVLEIMQQLRGAKNS